MHGVSVAWRERPQHQKEWFGGGGPWTQGTHPVWPWELCTGKGEYMGSGLPSLSQTGALKGRLQEFNAATQAYHWTADGMLLLAIEW